jgi:hypothetical protein
MKQLYQIEPLNKAYLLGLLSLLDLLLPLCDYVILDTLGYNNSNNNIMMMIEQTMKMSGYIGDKRFSIFGEAQTLLYSLK